MRNFEWGVRMVQVTPGVGEVVPGAEDPCYDAAPGLSHSFCLDQQAHPEKWTKWQAEWKKRNRPRIQIPGEMVKDAQAQHAAEIQVSALPWYDRPLVTVAPELADQATFVEKLGTQITAKRAAIAAAVAYLGAGAVR